MKKLRVLLLLVVALLWGRASAEEVFVEVVRLSDNSQLSWTISNTLDHTVASSEDYLLSDTVAMILDGDQRFRFNLNVDDIAPQDTDLLLIQLNGAGIMLIKSDIGFGEFSYPFFTGYKQPTLKIVGGSYASISDFPWQVYFSSGDYMCGGSIISKRWILTAAHCTQDGVGIQIDSADMRVKVGTSTPYASTTGKWYDVKNYTVHKSYSKNTLRNDIAVLELYEDIDFSNAEVIELVSDEDVAAGATDPGVMSLVSGWGLSGVSPDIYPSTLQKVELPIISNTTAAEVWGTVPSTMLMAGYKNGNKDACSGDSGGPLVVDVDGEKKLAGVVSWGSEECNTYGAFTRVSSFLDWIEDNTGVTPRVGLSKPIGESEICQGTLRTDYSTGKAVEGSYEWFLSPDSAGVLIYDEDSAYIIWSDGYLGKTYLNVRGVLEGVMTPWSSLSIEIQENTVIHSVSGDIVVCEGEQATMRVEADGHNLSYSWYKDDVFYRQKNVGILSYSFSDTLDAGSYHCVVSGSCGELVTGIINLTVYPETEIISISEDLDVVQNDDVAMTVNSVGHDRIYQWYKDGDIITDATASTLSLNSVDANDIGLYHVEVVGSCMSDISQEVYLYVGGKKSDDVQARIWPSYVTTELNTAISTNGLYALEVYNMKGHLVYSEQNISNQSLIDASPWANGSYIIKINSQGFSESYRIIKK